MIDDLMRQAGLEAIADKDSRAAATVANAMCYEFDLDPDDELRKGKP